MFVSRQVLDACWGEDKEQSTMLTREFPLPICSSGTAEPNDKRRSWRGRRCWLHNRRGEPMRYVKPPARDTVTANKYRGRNQYKLFSAPVCENDILTLLLVILSPLRPSSSLLSPLSHSRTRFFNNHRLSPLAISFPDPEYLIYPH